MSFDLILPFLRPIEPLLLDESVSEIMGNPDLTWWYERDGVITQDRGVQFEAERLRTGLEVVANKLGKKTRRRQSAAQRAAPRWEPPCSSDSTGRPQRASTCHSQVHQPPFHY